MKKNFKLTLVALLVLLQCSMFTPMGAIAADLEQPAGASVTETTVTDEIAAGEITSETITPTITVYDLALTPGSDETQLNLAWYMDSACEGLFVEITPDFQQQPAGHHRQAGQPLPQRFEAIATAVKVASTTNAALSSVTVYACQANITGLRKMTGYTYRFGDSAGNLSKDYSYSTKDSRKFGFVFLADSQIGASAPRGASGDVLAAAIASDIAGWTATVNEISSDFPETSFIMADGDLVENQTNEIQYSGLLKPEALTTIPMAPAIGSHDEAVNFDYHFNLPNESETLGDTPAGSDYYYTYGNVLFMVLNMDQQMSAMPKPLGQPGVPYTPTADELAAYNAKIAAGSDCSEHKTFMEGAIAANPDSKWKIVMWHYSIYSSGMHASDDSIVAIRNNITPTMDALDIDAVFMGHDHSYCRTYQMLGNQPQPVQNIGADGSSVVNPTGTLYLSSSSSSGSKFYGLHSNVNSFAYPAVKNGDYAPVFSYISVTDDTLSFDMYQYTASTDTLSAMDSYTMVKDDTLPELRFYGQFNQSFRNVWSNEPVSINFKAFDRISGVKSVVDSSSKSAVSPLVIATEGKDQTVTLTVTDYGMNSASFTSPKVSIDLTAPEVSVAGISNGDVLKRNSKVKLYWNATDALSGIAGVRASQQSGSYIYTARQGSYKVTVIATDKAGNETAKTINYSVK